MSLQSKNHPNFAYYAPVLRWHFVYVEDPENDDYFEPLMAVPVYELLGKKVRLHGATGVLKGFLTTDRKLVELKWSGVVNRYLSSANDFFPYKQVRVYWETLTEKGTLLPSWVDVNKLTFEDPHPLWNHPYHLVFEKFNL